MLYRVLNGCKFFSQCTYITLNNTAITSCIYICKSCHSKGNSIFTTMPLNTPILYDNTEDITYSELIKRRRKQAYWQKQSLKALWEGKRMHDPAVSQQDVGARREWENTAYWGFNNTEIQKCYAMKYKLLNKNLYTWELLLIAALCHYVTWVAFLLSLFIQVMAIYC